MKTFSITDVGQLRDMNQDYCYTSENPVGNLPNLFIVADGMGGHNAGDYASKYTVEQIVDVVSKSQDTDPGKIIAESIKCANEMLLERANEDAARKGMGTTVVVLTVTGNKLIIANVGDSRLYIVNDVIKQITKDHSYVQEMVRLGEMDEETAKAHPDKNIITRAIGVGKEVAIDFFEEEVKAGDVILMCSDGLTNMVEDDVIRNIINGQRDIAEKAEKLVETANRNGGKDNITVVVIEPFSDEVKKC
ncbi:MAG: Stp1/IreP family PP2C-type Ser/Thr phosphatase [Lachnospiraceae bacterium]|nr:Stp1/IreP family PP2C-type Ser/Thr phosphatase [Lachnospiraceae bacterium]